MADERTSWTLGELALQLNGSLHGPTDRVVRRAVPAGVSDPEGITFATNPKFLEQAIAVPIGVVLVGQDVTTELAPIIQVERPKAAFAEVLAMLHRPPQLEPGVHPAAHIAPGAAIDSTASIGAGAFVAGSAVIGPGARIHPGAHVGDRCMVAAGAEVYPGAVLVQDVQLGARSVVFSGAVLGSDGFGFEWDGIRHVKIPQIGGVRIGADCEIGANACIDRGTMGDTVLGDGVKVDNLCQIAHNVVIGEHSVLTGQVGIGGSSQLGRRNVIGAGSGISDHVSLADDVSLGGRTGVAQDIPEKGVYFGTPAQPIREALRTFTLIPRLPEIWRRLRQLEQRLGGSKDDV